ncbi:MAG TPA: helix-turn-helix domain-containing protein [Steroidobacteraceae bacterium]|nr:helix-turn-helix domain-containing protein [Steroidobacteraceae bacterium]HQX78439.1 helix-turn-helix domain-containing protein [Steroidobacteraceae bacterium]HQZ79000.1 helix-turn-helix domain-containing protein [Steroidobacteraceae bacterium]
MESTRPIRALIRGLDALTVLNLRNGATVSEVAQEIRLPRTTTYRILETLSHAGYVYRDPVDDRYRLTIMVRGLSDGFDDEAWVTQVARPYLNELTKDIVWPVAIASLSGTSMMVRESTDHRSPLAVERFSAGFRVPLLTSASGRIFLAFSSAAQRDSLLEILSRSTREVDKLAVNRSEVQKILAEARNQGYATAVRPRRVTDEITMAVPIQLDDRVLAAVSVRFSGTAVPMKLAVERFLPKLRETAGHIRASFIEQQRDPPHQHHRPAQLP